MNKLLSIKNLTVTVGRAKILDNVSFDVEKGKIVGIVGGSGSGKTTLGLSILKLLPPAMQMTGGQILFQNTALDQCTGDQLRRLRGGRVGMVFQEPLSAFDPLFTIGAQLDETLLVHSNANPQQRKEIIMRTLSDVEIQDPQRIYSSYPHQLSGGLRQRAMIAHAIICNPDLIIADEPTSSLDVTIQAKIMQLLRKLNKERGITIILISHDLGMVGHLAHDAIVMTEGKIVETGRAEQILRSPQHAYTKALMEAY
jgi:ABC-type glutathione transport system ATPase component